MGFEYDKAKSRANQRGYGIDFEREQTLWEDLDRVEIPARTVDEPRFLVVAKTGGKRERRFSGVDDCVAGQGGPAARGSAAVDHQGVGRGALGACRLSFFVKQRNDDLYDGWP